MRGENHYMYGKKQSPETLEKISKALSGENNPMYGKRGENNPNFGRKASTETRKKMSKAQSGKKRSPESNLKRSKAMSGENNSMSRKNREARQRKKLEQEGIIQLDNYLK
jgi:hypothetical protein